MLQHSCTMTESSVCSDFIRALSAAGNGMQDSICCGITGGILYKLYTVGKIPQPPPRRNVFHPISSCSMRKCEAVKILSLFSVKARDEIFNLLMVIQDSEL